MVSLREWIQSLTEYSVQSIDDLNGVVVGRINEELYLVKRVEVKE